MINTIFNQLINPTDLNVNQPLIQSLSDKKIHLIALTIFAVLTSVYLIYRNCFFEKDVIWEDKNVLTKFLTRCEAFVGYYVNNSDAIHEMTISSLTIEVLELEEIDPPAALKKYKEIDSLFGYIYKPTPFQLHAYGTALLKLGHEEKAKERFNEAKEKLGLGPHVDIHDHLLEGMIENSLAALN